MKMIVLVLLAALFFLNSAYGMGKKPKTDPAAEQKQAYPVRYVTLDRVSTFPFKLPNGMEVDLNQNHDVDLMIATEFNNARKFVTIIPGEGENLPPASRYLVAGGLSSFEFEVAGFNIKFGYTPSGEIEGDWDLTGIEGALDVNISSMSMDLHVYDSVTGHVYSAAYADRYMAEITPSVTVNFSELTAGIDLIYKTPIGDAMRKLMRTVIGKLENSRGTNLLPWEGTVLGTDANTGTVFFNAGVLEDIHSNEMFGVYRACDSSNSSCFEKFITEIQVTDVRNYYSEGKILENSSIINSVSVGDKVYIKYIGY